MVILLQILYTCFGKFLYHIRTIGCWRVEVSSKYSFLSEIDLQLCSSHDNISAWTANKPYHKGSMVIHNGMIYIAMGDQNLGVPGHMTDYVLFVFSVF
jgi:hypothetical protein